MVTTPDTAELMASERLTAANSLQELCHCCCHRLGEGKDVAQELKE
jgi:hypothetical protein